MSEEEASQKLEKDLEAVRKAHPEPLHHYENQPTVEKLKAEKRRRREKRFERALDIFTILAATLAIIMFGGFILVLLLLKKGLGI